MNILQSRTWIVSAALVAASTLAAACSAIPVSEDLQRSVYGEAKKKLFAKDRTDSAARWQELEDRAVQKYVQSVGDRVRAKSSAGSAVFVIMDTPVVQASSGLGGLILVTRGMLAFIRNEAELACLLGHEIAHEEQIAAGKWNPNEPSSLKRSLIRELTPESLRDLGVQEDLEDISYSNFQKDRETEADERGTLLCQAAGYDAMGLANLQGRLAQQVKSGALDAVKNLKGTHAMLKDRAEHLVSYLRSNNGTQSAGVQNASEYLMATKGLRLRDTELTSAQRQTLAELGRLGTTVDRRKSTLKLPEVIEIVDQLSRIVQKERVLPDELGGAGPGQGSDSFMRERVIYALGRDSGFRTQLIDQIQGVLSGLSRIGLGFIPYVGAGIDLYEAVSGKDFFTGKALTSAERIITATGFVIGQGSTLRSIKSGLEAGVYRGAEAAKILRAAEEEVALRKYVHIERFGPIKPGPLHERRPYGATTSVADTFRSSSYSEIMSSGNLKLYRVDSKEVSPPLGQYWSEVPPTGPLQATLDSALNPAWGNRATHWVEITVPPKTRLYQGSVSEVVLTSGGGDQATGRLLGGGTQIYVPQQIPSSWITNRGKF